MTTEIHEEQPSRSIRVGNDGASQRRQYWMKNYTESEQAWLALREYSPAEVYIGGFLLVRSSVEVSIEHSDPEQTLYRGVVEYLSPTAGGATDKAGGGGGGGGGDSDLPTNGEGGKKQDEQSDGIEEEDPAKIFFTFGTKQTTITQALGQAKWNAVRNDGTLKASTFYETFDLDINKDGDDQAPEGVSIPDATMFMHVRHIRPAASMTPAFYKTLRYYLYSVNAIEFGYFDPGTVQFVGVELTPMKSGDYKCEYKFEIGQKLYETADNGAKTMFITVDGVEQPFTILQELGPMAWSPFNYTWFSYNTIGRDTKIGGPGQEDVDTFVRKLDSVNNAVVYQYNPYMSSRKNLVFGHMNKAATKLDKNWASVAKYNN